ncbi:MAG: DNA repair protein RecO [Candidatus Acidiferrales bacterium]|jgi:DNA repair protein RecO (recombination protein O)
MPLHESEAIVLRSYPLAEADRLVSFLSRTMGRVRGVAAGARKTKSRFGSTLQNLSHVRIWYYERETRDLVRINQCEIIESFLDVFGDYTSSVALALFSEITEAVLPEREVADANFRLLLLSAQTVKRTRKPEVPLAYFAVWTVKLGGWLPALDVCVKCGSMLAGKAPRFFSASALAAFCANCRRSGMRTLSPGAFSGIRRILSERLDRIGEQVILPVAAREITDAMLDIVEQQIDRKLTSRRQLELPE